MKTIKRIAAMLLCIACLLFLAACGVLNILPGTGDDGAAEPAATEQTKVQPAAPTADGGSAADAPQSPAPEETREMAGSYALRSYSDNTEIFYDYAALENQRIVNGSTAGELTLNGDGTGHMRWLGKEADVAWDEENLTVDGTAYSFFYRDQTLYIETPQNESVEFSKASHLAQFEQSALYGAGHSLAAASDYALGEPKVVRYNEGSRAYVLVYVPIENRSDRQLVLDSLYFTACKPDGTELAFFQLPANYVKLLLPGETGQFIFPLFVDEATPYIPGHTAAAFFPEDVKIRIDEVDVYLREGAYQRLDAEITAVDSFVDTATGTYMVRRPNGFVALPEGVDINNVEICVYCCDTDGNIIGFGSQTACLSSVNPVNYFEEIPGEHRAKFQTNMNGPFGQLDFPAERVGSYTVVASAPLNYEY